MAPYPILLGDIGGTFTRFALLNGPGSSFQLLAKGPTSAHSDPPSAIRAVLRTHGRPNSALLAVAGRVSGPIVHLTNANWTIDVEQIGRDLGLQHVVVLNDYAATAASLTRLGQKER